jgi:hypothetical protein
VRPLLLALTLSGCATTSDERLGWFCQADLSANGLQASSLRSLDARGQLRSGNTDWALRPTASELMEIRVSWPLARSVLERERASVRFRMSREVVQGEQRQLQLIGPGSTLVAGGSWSGGTLHELAISGAQLETVLQRSAPLSLRLVNRAGAVRAESAVAPALFSRGLELARQADGRALARSTDFQRQCEREQRIAPT